MTNNRNPWALVMMAALASGSAQAYEATATVTFSWGQSAVDAYTNSGTGFSAPAATSGVVKGWTSSGTGPIEVGGSNALNVMTNSTAFNALAGDNATVQWNSQSYLNSDFMAADGSQCTLGPLGPGSQRRYQCTNSAFQTILSQVADIGPGASATGNVTVTDTTLTGTLTVVPTTDEADVRSAAGYNVRSADGSPFGNAWYGISTVATIALNLTGTFTATSWNITGGTTNLRDSSFGFECNQTNNTLCNVSTQFGGYGNDGSAQNPGGWDLDGGGTGLTVAEIVVNTPGGDISLGGVLATVPISAGAGNGTGEARTALGSSSCTAGKIVWNGSAISCGTLTVQGVSIAASNVVEVDATPDDFNFVNVTDAAVSTAFTSNTVNITGISVPLSISSLGGNGYSIGCTGTFVTSAGTVNNNDTVCVQITSSALPGTATDLDLTVGTVTRRFTVTTFTPDTTPDAFTFTDVTGAAVSTPLTSNTVTINGINAAAAISVTGAGGEYSKGCTGTFTTAADTINNGETVCVRNTSGATPGTTVDTTLTVGGVSDVFRIETIAADTDPDAFTFGDLTDVAVSTVQTSNTITIAGLNVSAPLTVTGGTYSLNGGAFTAAPVNVDNGDTVAVRHTSSASGSTAVNTTLTVGATSDTFTSTTLVVVSAEPKAPGSSSADGVMLGLLGLLALARGRRRVA